MAGHASPSPHINFVVELQYSGLDVLLALNGIELVRGVASEGKVIQLKINGWMKSGSNDIVLSAGVPVSPQASRPLDLKCLIFRGPHGRQPDESEAIVRFAERDRANLPPGQMQVVWKGAFSSDPHYGPWRWESANPLAASPDDRTAALGLMASVQDALNAGRVDELLEIFHVMIQETARALGIQSRGFEASLRGWAGTWARGHSRPLSGGDYDMAVEGDHRLLRIVRRDGRYLFTADPGRNAFGPRLIYVSYLQEGWAIVRAL